MYMNSVGCLQENCNFRLCEQCFDEMTDYEFKLYSTGPERYLYTNKPPNFLLKPFVDSEEN